jgi:hypothetical protein
MVDRQQMNSFVLVTEIPMTDRVAYGYIRCSVPDDWEEFAMSCSGYPSRSTKNRLFNEQWRRIRAYARRKRIGLRRRFFDPEGGINQPSKPLSLPRRQRLAELFLAARSGDPPIVLVDEWCRLDENAVVCALLCEVFGRLDVLIIETQTGTHLTDRSAIETVLSKADPNQVEYAKRLVAFWKGLARRLQTKIRLGRKPFGSVGEENVAIARIRALYRVLPRHRWRRRGRMVWKRRSFREIANMLNAEGVRTRTGKAWSGSVVMGILKRLKLKEPATESAGPMTVVRVLG